MNLPMYHFLLKAKVILYTINQGSNRGKSYVPNVWKNKKEVCIFKTSGNSLLQKQYTGKNPKM